MHSTQEQRIQEISHWLLGKTLAGVSYFYMNRDTCLHPNQPLQLVDAGVQLSFTDGSLVTFGWDFSVVIFDLYNQSFEEKLKAYNDSIPFMLCAVETDEKWAPLLGKTIQQIHVAWNWYEDMDGEIHYVPQDLEMVFDQSGYAAICTTSYTVDEEGITITHPDSEGELLVLFEQRDTEYYKRGRYSNPVPLPGSVSLPGDEEE